MNDPQQQALIQRGGDRLSGDWQGNGGKQREYDRSQQIDLHYGSAADPFCRAGRFK